MTFPFSSSHISTTIGETTLIMYVTWPDTFKIVSFQYVFSVISPDFLISYPFLSFQSLKSSMYILINGTSQPIRSFLQGILDLCLGFIKSKLEKAELCTQVVPNAHRSFPTTKSTICFWTYILIKSWYNGAGVPRSCQPH